MNIGRVAIYARVSTDGQTVNNQLDELRSLADRHGWIIAAEVIDRGISGVKGRDERPQFDAILKAATVSGIHPETPITDQPGGPTHGPEAEAQIWNAAGTARDTGKYIDLSYYREAVATTQ